MSAAAACMPPLVPSSSSSPLHGTAGPAMAPAAEAIETRRQPSGMETARAVGAEGTVGCVNNSHGDGGGDMSKPRAVVRTLTCERKMPLGEGFALWRSIGRAELPELDPILSFDEFEFSPPAGFPDHPHRGFENVTYMLEGGISYHDFSGHKGTISTGDVQWLTAGRGVVHSEMPAGHGVQRGINIWINLAAEDKIVEPRYQDLARHDIPTGADEDGGVSVKVIAGECLGARSPLRPRTPALCLDVALRPGGRLRQHVPRGWSACAYVIGGEACFFGGGADCAVAAGARTLVVFGGDGDGVDVRADDAGGAGARVMLVAARPHGEAVARDGPFVMNTREEVEQAREDYRHRRNGFEMADGWASDHTTLLKALAGKRKVTAGEIHRNGVKLDEFVPEKTAAYIDQYGLRVLEMTIKETIDFARFQSVGNRADKLPLSKHHISDSRSEISSGSLKNAAAEAAAPSPGVRICAWHGAWRPDPRGYGRPTPTGCLPRWANLLVLHCGAACCRSSPTRAAIRSRSMGHHQPGRGGRVVEGDAHDEAGGGDPGACAPMQVAELLVGGASDESAAKTRGREEAGGLPLPPRQFFSNGFG
ncbi:hypothetical protein U9M48_039304 [Paspalum notatum var. saurae]|uniref:Pirin n=1 Tax=Paspalum notatum var. saurae TaxID=547442 RepID=A0AAQ3UJV5_PASNO